MANVQFILSELGFGINREPVVFEQQDLQPEDASMGTSLLGTPVFDRLTLEAGNYRKDGKAISFKGIEIDAVLFTVNRSKNIVRTQVQGRNGTVKEYISDGDYEVSIAGVLVGQYPRQYPEEDMERLLEICNAQVAIGVQSRFLQLFNITDLVITEREFTQRQGYANTQVFQIRALSDSAIELQLSDSNESS